MLHFIIIYHYDSYYFKSLSPTFKEISNFLFKAINAFKIISFMIWKTMSD